MRIILTRGIPASGKSTWALEQEKEKGALLFNKDSIREDLHGGVYSKENEKEVIRHERYGVEEDMNCGAELIIVDNTHLGHNNKHVEFYRALAKEHEYSFSIRDFYCSREDAIKRDKLRDKPVGEAVINKMIKVQGNGGYPANAKFRPITGMLPQAIILDIDGTLAFMDDKRGPYEGHKVSGDRANSELNWLVGQLQKANPFMKTIVLSGRDSKYRQATLEWLDAKSVDYDELYMRVEGDKRQDSLIKKELFYKHIDGAYDVRAVFDDRNRVVDMWRLEIGLPTYQVWYGLF